MTFSPTTASAATLTRNRWARATAKSATPPFRGAADNSPSSDRPVADKEMPMASGGPTIGTHHDVIRRQACRRYTA